MIKQLLKGVMPVVLGLVMASLGSATPLIVDNFNGLGVNAIALDSSIAAPDTKNVATSGLGGWLQMTALVQSGSGETTADARFDKATLNNGSGVVGKAEYMWTGSPVGTPMLNLDMTGYAGFTFDLLSTDQNGTVTIEVGNPSSSAFVNIFAGQAPPTVNLFVSKASFFGLIDWADVDFIKITLQAGGPDGDIAIDNLNLAVPEPSTYALLGAGLMALGFLRRKK